MVSSGGLQQENGVGVKSAEGVDICVMSTTVMEVQVVFELLVAH